MPYIPKAERAEFDRGIDSLYIDTPGKLAYGVSRLIRKFIMGGNKPGFLTFALVGGALLYSLLEFYRRVVAPYEDKKIEENGDVER